MIKIGCFWETEECYGKLDRIYRQYAWESCGKKKVEDVLM